jgi:TadE-like protein
MRGLAWPPMGTHAGRSGQAMVEFALALPLCLLVLLGSIQLGLYGLTRGSVVAAAGRGARVAAGAAATPTGPPATDRVYASIRDQLASGLIGARPAPMAPVEGSCPPLSPSWPVGTVYVCAVHSVADGTVEVAVRGWVHALVPPSFGLGSSDWRAGALPINEDLVVHTAVFAP